MNNQSPSHPSLVPIGSVRHVELPSFFIAVMTKPRSCSMFWWSIGTLSSSLLIVSLLIAFTDIPWLHDYSLVLGGFPWIMFAEVLSVVYFFAFSYLTLVSHLRPSEPLGCYIKHGFELFVLFAALLLMRFSEFEISLLFVFSIITHFHAYCQVQYHPPDLSNLDWIVEVLMQVAVHLCGYNKYGIATVCACLMAICYRFCSYSCPETSHLPVGYIEKLRSEKAC